ncbi:MAG: fibronectin type III domain-containing protein [Planctomycetia bacterium]
MIPHKSLISQLFDSRSRWNKRRVGHRSRRVVPGERLEQRRLLAFDLVAAFGPGPDPFFASGVTGNSVTLNSAPQQITLRFSPGVKIDPATLGNISIVRSGAAGDGFGILGTRTDVAITPGHISVNDLPNENEVIVRFAETLPDDSYRITVLGGATGLRTMAGDTLAANHRSIDVRLDLGAHVLSVVPQPVVRSASGLAQARNRILVVFNTNDPLNVASAQNLTSYRLFEVDPATGSDANPLAPTNPTSVAYDAATGRATLLFASGAIADGKLYRLQVGAAETLPRVSQAKTEGMDFSNENSSFTTAFDLGQLTVDGITVFGAVDPSSTVPTPLSGVMGPGGKAVDLLYPSQPGSIDEPGHRDLPPELGSDHGDIVQSLTPAAAIAVQEYNFRDDYGDDPQGNPLQNAITETQKQRAREIFELFSRYTGIRFVETQRDGLIVATGDVRAASPNTPPAAVSGIGGPGLAIMSSLVNWGASEYGGGWFQTAMHEIGHALGLEHSYDLPSIMGAGLTGEPVFPGDYDTIHLAQRFPANGSDVDIYKFTVSTAGRVSIETVVGRPGEVATSRLDSLLTLYREETVSGKTVRTVIARNDDYFGRDSFIGLDLDAGTYCVAVSSTGNDRFNPDVADSGYGGRTDGAYRLQLGFTPKSATSSTIVDTSGIQLDGDRDGEPGGAFNFWFRTAASTDTPSTNRTLFVDKESTAHGNGDGTRAKPFKQIDAALAEAAKHPGSIVRIVGNAANTPYRIGTDLAGRALPDGATLNVPANVTVMIDAGAVFKLRAAIIDVGSSSALVSRAGAALQVLGLPSRNVTFTSDHDDTIGGNSDGMGPAVTGGQWGGIVLRNDSDFTAGSGAKTAFLNTISQARIAYGGGQVLVDSQLDSFAPIQLESTRPTVAFNTITDSAGAAISATPNSFEESDGRIGPEIRGNTLTANSINGLFVKIRTPFGGEPERLDVPARFRNTDIVYVLQDNLFIAGGAGGYVRRGTQEVARRSGRLTIDPGVIVKLQGARIELERGTAQLLAEGMPGQSVIFTSLSDNRFGAGGTFDTNGNLPDVFAPGDWGGIVLNAGSKASIDYAYIAHGGGLSPIEGTLDRFNVIETHQGDMRLANSRVEFNSDGAAATNRTGRGGNTAATVFVRGAQPVILGNDFRNNLGTVISVNANSLTDAERPDPGRSTGLLRRDNRYDYNRGPLIRDNRLFLAEDNQPAGGAIQGLEVRGEEITVESVWDDTDIVHVLRSEITVQNFHTATGVRLLSQTDASLVVKLDGDKAGFTAAGYGLDIADRIGGTVQVVGQPGYPVVLTSLKDDTVGVSLDPLGRLMTDTNADGGASLPTAGDWRSLKFLPFSNDRNVELIQETERAAVGWVESNGAPSTAQVLGVLAPNSATGANTAESAQEKSGDDNRRLGFELHGVISFSNPGDVDVYTFTGYAGSEVWIDIDKTSPSLDAMVEVLNAAGVVVARSADSQTDLALSGQTRGLGQNLAHESWRGGDFYTVNPRDPGMRLILPGTTGAANRYYVRVRSQPRYEAGTSAQTFEADLVNDAKLASGATSGSYELRVRLRQRDEKPGSTVRYADVRFPQIGIDVQGLPRSSLLTGETGETSAENGTFGSAQYVGNLLQSDKNALSIAGAIGSPTDVDWYTFALNYEQIQSISGVNAGLKSWSTVFDIDYGDGLRGDLSLYVFDSTGRLIFTGRDSDISSDQPGAAQGVDFDDLSRGSAGKLDPFIGSAQIPAGSPTGSGGIESGGSIVPPDPSKQLRYYVAVASNRNLPTVLDATFRDSATNALIRLEPISSVERIAEDHIGFTGYTSYGLSSVQPTNAAPLIDVSSAISLTTHITPFTLSDVTLFVSTGRSLVTIDAMRGLRETIIEDDYGIGRDIGDIVMRSDGLLHAYVGLANTPNTAGRLEQVDAGSGVRTPVGNDGIPNPPNATTQTDTNLSPVNGASGTTAEFQLSQTGITTASVNGTVSYAGDTWVITTVAGVLVFTPAGTPTGPATPISGFVTPAGRVFITWNQAIAFSSTTLAATYSFTGDPQAINTDTVDAVAWQRTGVGQYANLFYSVREGARSRLYKADPANGSATAPTPNPNGYGLRGVIQDPLSSLGNVTGMAFVGNTLYGVDTKGYLFSINTGSGQATLIDIDPTTDADNNPLTPDPMSGVAFAGLTIGPRNLYGGTLSNALFAIDTRGTLYAFDTSGSQLSVFDTDGDGVTDAVSSRNPGLFGVTGLAFSPLDVNLWHPTTRRGTDVGHGINSAPDNTRRTDQRQSVIDELGVSRDFRESEGGASMYFGLERYVGSGKTPYLNYQTFRTQYGVLDPAWQQDLSTNAVIPDTYNLPGGAYGSLTTDSFSLSRYTYTDKPTLYFNYWLQTQGASGKVDTMRDSARVFVSTNGGATWEVIATNNSSTSRLDTSDAELPAFASVSSKISNDQFIDNQHVQELFDSSSWRQARIDLGKYAGQSDIRLRFDFSTAGEFDRSQNWAQNTTVTAAVTNLPDIEVADVSGIVEGMELHVAGVSQGLIVVAVDPATNTVSLDANVTLPIDAAVAFRLPFRLNDIAGLAGTTGNFGSRERGQNNQFEGFYVDDIIVGFAERGEMVTAAATNGTSFFDLATLGTPTAGTGTVPAQSLIGPYQLEIRRGTTYAELANPLLGNLAVLQTFDTNDDLVPHNPGQPFGRPLGNPLAAGWLGDGNTPRQQGQFLIQNNVISSAETYGVSIDAGVREPLSNAPSPGVVRNGPVLNNSRLVPGVVVANNILSSSGTAGILFSGEPDVGSIPNAAVPYGRIINNTIFGGRNPGGAGIVVTDNAGPTLMNNVFASLATGISVDTSSRVDSAGNQRTVITTSAFHAVGVQTNATQSQALTLSTSPFVNAPSGNFYPTAGSPVIDSAINSIADRAEYVAVTDPLGVPPSPVIAPDRDLLGQLRSDDPGQASFPGLGSNVFKDRGAIDRVDFTQPTARLEIPQDGGISDLDPADDQVALVRADARGLTRFVLRLEDAGSGIDFATVSRNAFVLSRNGVPLQIDRDYVVNILTPTRQIVFEAAVVFDMGSYEITASQKTVGGIAVNVITDLAGNPLLPNQPDGKTVFRIELADVPISPFGLVAVSRDAGADLSWQAAVSSGSPVLQYEVQWATNDTFTAGVQSVTLSATTQTTSVQPLTVATPYWFRVRAANAVGASLWSNVAGPVVPMTIPVASLLNDTGVSATDGITNDGRVSVSGLLPGAIWEYSIDGGTSWTAGIASPFVLQPGLYPAGGVQVRQSLLGTFSSVGMNPISWTIDQTPPDAPGLTLGPAITNPVSANEATSPTGVLTISGIPDASAMISFEGQAGQRVMTTVVIGATGSHPVVLTPNQVSQLGNGLVSVASTQTDAAGNVQTVAPTTINFTLDTISPTLTSLSAPSGVYRAGDSIPITASFSEPIQSGSSLVIALNTGASVTLTTSVPGNTASGTYVIQAGHATTFLRATAISATTTVFDVAGNAMVSVALPPDGANFGSGSGIVIDGSLVVLTSAPFSTSPIRVSNLGASVTQVPVRFTTPVTGVNLAAFQLFLDGRPVSLRDAQVSGSGSQYVLTLPPLRANPSGIYTLLVRNDTGIRAIANGVLMASPGRIYWGKDTSIVPTVLESAGSVTLAHDAAGALYANDFMVTSAGGPVDYQDMAASGWTAVAADTIDGANSLLWRHASGNLHLWRLDGAWRLSNSEGWYAPGSPQYYATETAFGTDLDGDGRVGAPFTTIETSGSVALAYDGDGRLHAGNTRITLGGNPVDYNAMNAAGWQAIAAEPINGVNTLVWRHISGNLHFWRLSGSWEVVLTEGWQAPGSAEYYATETAFGMDFDGNTVIGAPLTTIEAVGAMPLAYDGAGRLYAGANMITLGGNPVDHNAMVAQGWNAVAVDTANGVNTLVWRHASGNLHLWRLSATWAHLSSEGWYAPGSPAYYATENAFGMDFDTDTVIGAPLTVIEAAGSASLGYDSAGRLYAGGDLITLGGHAVDYNAMNIAGWQAIAADRINGINTLVWRHVSGNLHVWRLSSTWAHMLSEGWYAPGSAEYRGLETMFGMDFDGNGTTGS